MNAVWDKYRAFFNKNGQWYKSGFFFTKNKPVMLGFICPATEEEYQDFLLEKDKLGTQAESEEGQKQKNEWLKRFYEEGYILERWTRIPCILDGDKYPTLPEYAGSPLGRNPRNLEEHLQFVRK